MGKCRLNFRLIWKADLGVKKATCLNFVGPTRDINKRKQKAARCKSSMHVDYTKYQESRRNSHRNRHKAFQRSGCRHKSQFNGFSAQLGQQTAALLERALHSGRNYSLTHFKWPTKISRWAAQVSSSYMYVNLEPFECLSSCRALSSNPFISLICKYVGPAKTK